MEFGTLVESNTKIKKLLPKAMDTSFFLKKTMTSLLKGMTITFLMEVSSESEEAEVNTVEISRSYLLGNMSLLMVIQEMIPILQWL